MSKIKSAREEKEKSLAHDRRNVYGENQKASRKNIPLAKQRSHQSVRRATKRALSVSGDVGEERAADAQFNATSEEIAHKRKRFKKRPDASLNAIFKGLPEARGKKPPARLRSSK
jgi:hypothetical protein